MVRNPDSDTENPATRDPLDNFQSLSPCHTSHSRISILQDFHLSTNVVKVENINSMKIILILGNLVFETYAEEVKEGLLNNLCTKLFLFTSNLQENI